MKKLSHIGIAVRSLDEASGAFSRLLGIPNAGTETVEEQRVRVGFFRLGDLAIELTEATAPDSPIARFLEKRGEGIHHLAFEVDDLRTEIERLKDEGFEMIDEQPRNGAHGSLIAFIHPKSTHGILVELTQHAHKK